MLWTFPAITKELLEKGKSVKDICGTDISKSDLISVVRFSTLLHDVGKAKGIRDHVKKSLEMATEILDKYNIEDKYKSLILDTISRHHLKDNPRTYLQKTVCLADSLASAGDRPDLSRAETMGELLKISESTRGLYDSLYEGEKGVSLILGDVDRVHSYVFETSRLPEIRGASELLRQLNEEKLIEFFMVYKV